MSTSDFLLSIDPDIQKELDSKLQPSYLSPFATRDDQVLRRDPSRDQASITRTSFGRDVEKIINIPAYARYADKTQVFSFIHHDDICRRSLHVQLVSRIARNIGRILGLNLELIEAIALGHDLGHTPFGHAGEHFLDKIFHKRTGLSFHHNVHSVRVLDVLYPRNISLQTLDGALCHNGEFCQQILKRGNTTNFDQLDELVQACTTDPDTIGILRPTTLEGCLVRVCDMIAYLGKDRQDAYEMGLISDLDAFTHGYLGFENTHIIHNMTCDIVNNSYGQDRIALSEEAFQALKLAKRENYQVIYEHEGVMKNKANLVEEIFTCIYERCLEDLKSGSETSDIFTDHISYLQRKSSSFTDFNYVSQNSPDQIVVDYIASCTDRYFLRLYKKLYPHDSRLESRDLFLL